MNKKIAIHKNDLPNDVKFKNFVAVDTETTGLSLMRDRLCLIQLAGDDGYCHLVQFSNDFSAPNLSAILTDESILKVFHFARFDITIIKKFLNVDVNPIFCTKVASFLVRTYSNSHGLRDICRELLNITLDKEQQSSDWASQNLSTNQQNYAANDVLYLIPIMNRLVEMLKRENRLDIALECFKFLQTRKTLDLLGFEDIDIFSHSIKRKE